mgnify:CR=1 FL=1
MEYISKELNKDQIFLREGNIEDFSKVYEYDYKHLTRSLV